MNEARKLRRSAGTVLWLLIAAIAAAALEPGQPADSYIRTQFTMDNGLPGAVVDQIGQSEDGFLWLITNGSDLSRFDGKRFYHFEELRTGALVIAQDGDIWFGTPEDLKRIPLFDSNQFDLKAAVSYHPGPGKASNIKCLRRTRSGALLVGTADGLFRYEHDQFVALGPRVATRQVEEVPDGHLLVITEKGFIELAGSQVVPHPQLASRLGVKDTDIFYVLKDSHANTWYCTPMGVASETDGRIEKLGTYAPNGHAAFLAYEDQQGTIWIGKDEGLFRVTGKGLELVAPGMKVRSIYADRDGDLWVGTNGDGLYRFKDRAARMFTKEDGLAGDMVQTVLAAHDGAVWAGANCGGISRFDGTHFQTFNEKDGLVNSCVWALAEDANHDLWIGTFGGGAFRLHQGKFTQYSKSTGLAGNIIGSIVAARDGSVWFGASDGLSRLQNGQLHNFTTADGLSSNWITRVFEDRAGVIWVGTSKGLDRLAGDRFENFSAVPKTIAYPVGQDRNGGFFVELLIGSAVLRISKDRVDAIPQLSSSIDMVETAHGELWFGGFAIRRLPPDAFARSRQADDPLDYEPFSVADGLATAQASEGQHNLALTRDGKLWAGTTKGLATFDLSRLPGAKLNPAIYLTDVTIGRTTQHASRNLVLPTGTNHVEIDFAAVEISSPEKIRLQYRLDGVDSEWLDAGPNPRAIYSTLPAGIHALHIRACNRNGIWDRQGVVFTITQRPFFYQTTWFIAAMLALGVLLVVMFYRLRVRQISRSISAGFDERLAERTRVAREIHDTFLQTVQGSKLVADHALKDLADNARMVRAMGQLSTWLEQATEEGRAALNSLRASTTEKNDLAEAFRRAVDECGRASRAEISFSVTGESREMHPVVRDEVYRIGFEAIRNSCAHSGGDRLEVTLKYGHELTLSISDNGGGIDPEVVEKGKEGHFGLRGMRERAERIGSKFTLVSSSGSGTAITLVVPGRIAFRTARPSWLERIKSIFNPN